MADRLLVGAKKENLAQVLRAGMLGDLALGGTLPRPRDVVELAVLIRGEEQLVLTEPPGGCGEVTVRSPRVANCSCATVARIHHACVEGTSSTASPTKNEWYGTGGDPVRRPDVADLLPPGDRPDTRRSPTKRLPYGKRLVQVAE